MIIDIGTMKQTIGKNTMNEFKPYIPRYIDIRDVPERIFLFEDVQQLLKSDLFQNFTKEEHFSHFCMSEYYLMAIYNEGFKWRVVGTIKDSTNIDLPKWDGGRYMSIDSTNHYEELDKNQIKYTCGNQAVMIDGSYRKLVQY